MADQAELRHMVMSFRVSELQVLLGFAGRNKSGRKTELLQRALHLLDRGCSTPIQIKIRELYRRRFPAKLPKGSPTPHPVRPPSATVSSPPKHGKYPLIKGMPIDYTKHAASSATASSASTSSSHHIHNQIPVNPDVTFKRLPFYDKLAELLKPSSLVPRSQTRFQENFFMFHLTPQQAQDVSMSRDVKPNGVCEYTVQVQLRFCLLETSCAQDDNFPPSICVRVNGKMAPLPNPIPTNKPGMEPKRPSRPVNITSICRLSPAVSNQISISWASEYGRSYCVSVYLVRRLNSSILLQRLKQKGTRHPDHTRALIKEKLQHDPDSEIATTSLRVSLMCPLGKMRMSIPCRASTCNHLQCFDAPMYLQMNEKKPAWICPVCDKHAEYDHLFIDGLFSEIVADDSDTNEIRFTEEGDWLPIKLEDKRKARVEEIQVVQTISDSPIKKEKVDTTVIDLTETDDEETDDDDDVAHLDDDKSTTQMVSSDSSNSSGGISVLPTSVASPPSVISTTPFSSVSALSAGSPCGSMTGHSPRSGCVSPPVISLDFTPSPASLNRSPSITPLSNPPRSPYFSHIAAASTPPSLLPQPPPAHSNHTRTPPPPPLYPFYGSHTHMDNISDTEMDDFLSVLTGASSHYAHSALNPWSLPYPLPMLSHSHRGSDHSSDSNSSKKFYPPFSS